MAEAKHTPGPWSLVEATEHHGPYITSEFGADIADCYCMSNPNAASIRNGGTSYPINHCGEQAHANARLIAAAPDMLEALAQIIRYCDGNPDTDPAIGRVAICAIEKATGAV